MKKFTLPRDEANRIILSHFGLPGDVLVVIGPKTKTPDPVQTLRPVVTVPSFIYDLGHEAKWREIEANLVANNKIGAIKELRLISGAGLKAAKDAVENWRDFKNTVLEENDWPTQYYNGTVWVNFK